MQHFERGGVSAAPFSSSVNERGRWNTQMCPCGSAVMPPTWPMIQLFGSGFGQDASTANFGTSPARAALGIAATPISMAAVMLAKIVRTRFFTAGIERARFCIGMMAASLDFLGGFFPLGRQSIAGKGRSQLDNLVP